MLLSQTREPHRFGAALITGQNLASQHIADFVVCTQSKRWVIPYNCEILKTLLNQQQLKATDLQFSSKQQCHGFIRRLLLLAAQDECRHRLPSELATLARELINQQR